VTYIAQIGDSDRHVVDLLEVIHAVCIRDVRRTTEDVDDGGVEFLQLALVHRHAAHGRGAIDDQPRVLHDDGGQTRVAGHPHGLDAATAESGGG
jgi:hypothetical protein